MSFGGHVQDMVNRMKENEALKNARKNRRAKALKKVKGELIVHQSQNNLNKTQLSKEELIVVKNRIRMRIRSERNRKFIFTIITVAVICCGLFYLTWTSQNPKR